jgi:small-conductance mechanosensitive channel
VSARFLSVTTILDQARLTEALGRTNITAVNTAQDLPDTGDLGESLSELSGLGLSDWLWAGGIFLAGIIIGLSVGRLAARLIDQRTSPFIARLIGRVIAALFITVGFVYAMNQLGVSIGPVLGLLGLAGLAIALAFQDLLENIIAGIFMSIRRPFDAGHQVSVNDFEGTVETINLRETGLVGFDGVRIHLPNAGVWANPIVNYTELGRLRTTLEVGVSYSTDLDQAREVILDVMRDIEELADTPAPEAFVEEFGDSGIQFAVRFWHGADFAIRWRVRDRLARALKKRFDAEGITIPFPQRDVHIIEPPPD